MVNIEVKEFKIKINKKVYTFRLDFKSLIKFDEKYSIDGINLFNKFLEGKEVYECIMKILSCACVEKEWTEEELSKSIPFNFSTMKLFDEITFALAEGLVNPKEDDEDEKN